MYCGSQNPMYCKSQNRNTVFIFSSTVLKRSNVKSVPRRRAPPRRDACDAPGNRIIRCGYGAGFSRRAFPASQRVVRKLGVAGSLRRVERIRKSKIVTIPSRRRRGGDPPLLLCSSAPLLLCSSAPLLLCSSAPEPNRIKDI